MKLKMILSYFFILTLTLNAYGDDWFPTQPDPALTPGAICSQSDELRYPEQIHYCERNVLREEKWSIINAYMSLWPQLKISNENRTLYKIDHFIPLCMGGANDQSNLWPQHRDVYIHTDSIEKALCDELSKGLIKQSEAIAQIKFAKTHFEQLIQNENGLQWIKENYLLSQ